MLCVYTFFMPKTKTSSKISFRFAVLFISLAAVIISLVGIAMGTPAKDVPPAPPKTVHVLKIDAAITAVVAEYIEKAVDRAVAANAEALIIQLNTPGGRVDSMEQIVMKMLSANVPIVVYVAPQGGRAASAGVFIALAANIVAMAPSTHIGAAHPVTMTGSIDKVHEEKIVNDLAAMIRGLAEKHGRNAQWAEEAVRKSVSITETEALKLKVIDLVAQDVPALLKAIHGRTVDLMLGKKVLDTEHAQVEETTMGFRFKLLDLISDPNIAYILLILGFYGLYFELSNPGAIFPGVAGSISLILAFYSLSNLPINYAGLMLIILALALFIAEAFITSHGVLGIGGTIAMVIGSVMLIDSPSPYLRISWAVIIPVVALSALLFIITVSLAVRVQREKADTGKEGMLGLEGEAKTDVHAQGQVFVRGEYWNAWSDEPVRQGERVKVEAIVGLKLKIKKVPQP
jgi:membrane-bound serine protease (ClpP class)